MVRLGILWLNLRNVFLNYIISDNKILTLQDFLQNKQILKLKRIRSNNLMILLREIIH
jgi:hypothetical protein